MTLKNVKLILASLLVSNLSFSQIFSEDFTGPAAWTMVDNDGDTKQWFYTFANAPLDAAGDVAASFSFDGSILTPDNFIISPQITLPTTSNAIKLSWKVASNQPTAGGYYKEYYSVYVTTASDVPTIVASTPVFDSLLPGGLQFYTRTVDLSSFNGQNVFISFRHHNCTDKGALLLDDVMVTEILPNQAPVANDDNGGTIMENGADGTVNVLTNDTDANGNPTASSGHTVDLDIITAGVQTTITSPVDQTVWTYNTSTGAVTCNPATNFDGTTVMIYSLCDAGGLCDNATITFTVQNTTGISENTLISKVYPNPVKDILTIETNSKVSKIVVLALDGKEIASYKVDSKINVSNLNAGIYFLAVTSENGLVSKTKFIKE